MEADALDDALDRLHRRSDEWDGGLTNHGPMVAESLEHIGRAGAIEGFVAGYLDHLDDPLPRIEAIDPAHWGDRLGDQAGMTDWVDFFRARLAEDQWDDVVRVWVPRFVPGAISAATHGLLRTAHAARGLSRRVSPARIEELAHGLGYWAACYFELPAARPCGTLALEEALAMVPKVTLDDRAEWLISDRVRRIDPVPFRGAIEAAAIPDDPLVGVTAVAHLGARVLIANPRSQIALIHTVTAPASIRSLVGLIPPDAVSIAVGEAFKAVAALWATFGVSPPVTATATDWPEWEAIVEAAIVDGDDHHIKLAVAAHELATVGGGDDILLRAAAAGVLPTLAR